MNKTKVRNLMPYPMLLEDERLIGAAGTKEDTREYGSEEVSDLTKRDQQRVKRGFLEVVAEPEAEQKGEDKPAETETPSAPIETAAETEKPATAAKQRGGKA